MADESKEQPFPGHLLSSSRQGDSWSDLTNNKILPGPPPPSAKPLPSQIKTHDPSRQPRSPKILAVLLRVMDNNLIV